MRACLIVLSLFLATLALANVEEDWHAVIALDAGPQGDPKTGEEAKRLTLQYLLAQEKALRQFLSRNPDDSRCFDARLRLAHLLAVRGDFEGNAKVAAESNRLLNAMEKDPALSTERRSDVAFAKISLVMHHVTPADASARQELLQQARKFQKDFPSDRRTASLLAEIATLYDLDPKRKQMLLEEASSIATDDDLKQRIADDLKRIALLGKPLTLNFTSLDGKPINVENYRGKVVLIYFFAGWSMPAMVMLGGIQHAIAQLPPGKVQAIGISLDENKETLAEVLRVYKLDWPIYFDGKGWASPLVRSFGINALPTVWVLDQQGNLRTLNARDNAVTAIKRLLR